MSAPEYPEHLNPFRDGEKPKLKNSLRRSFREITGKIFRQQSFRKKKPVEHIAEEVEIRHPIRNPSYVRTTNVSSMLPDLRGNIEPLPRSRFKERISMNSHINGGATLYRTHEVQSLASLQFFNPFDGSETTPPPTPARRKSKKKAPLPPDSSNENISGDLNHRYRDSKWSLTSNDSENTYFDEISETSEVNYSLDLSKGLESFTKEMTRLNDDTLNDITEENRKSSVPDLIVSCPTPQNKEEEEIEEGNVVINDTNSKNVQYDKRSGDDVLEKLINNDSEKDEIELNNNIIIQEVTRFEDATDISNESNCKGIECDNENLDQINSNNALTDNIDRNEEISLYKQSFNSFKDEGIINIEVESTDEMAGFPNIVLSHEEVFPTNDVLHRIDDIVLRYILEDKEQSRKNLGSTHSLKEKSDSNFSNTGLLYLSKSNKEIYHSMESSVPKQRKNKLTKSILMGEQYSEY